MNLIECKVCGYAFDAVRSGHYIARENGKCGIAAISGEENALYDAFDCPVCGCQFIAQERKRQYEHLGFKEGKRNGGE